MRIVVCIAIIVAACVTWSRAAADSGVWAEPTSQAPQQWLVIGPFPAEPAPPGRMRPGLDHDYLASMGGEAQARLAADTVVMAGESRCTVRPATLDAGHAIDLVRFYNPDGSATVSTDFKVAYAYAEWDVPSAVSLKALLGTDDGTAVWLNGAMIHRVATPGRGVEIGQDRFDLPLVAGTNRLLIKVENGGGGWGLGLRLHTEQDLARMRELEARRDLDSLDPGPEEGGFLLDDSFPKLRWRNMDAARLVLADDQPLAVRWYGPNLEPATAPTMPGRYVALIETTTRDGLPYRHMLTFAKPSPQVAEMIPFYSFGPPLGDRPKVSIQWGEMGVPPLAAGNEAEISRHMWAALGEHVQRTEGGAILVASLMDRFAADPAAPQNWLDNGFIANAEHQLRLRMKLEGRTPRTLTPPQRLASPAPVLRDGSEADAGLKAGTVDQLRALCGEWLKDDKNWFVVLVARRGVIAMHEGFGGADKTTPFVPASIGKPIAGLTIARAVDQGLLKLDQPIGEVLAPWKSPHTQAVTLRYCVTHLSGLRGHASHGGLFDAYLDNDLFIQDAIFATPGRQHRYNGDGGNLAGKALELTTGVPMWRLLQENMQAPFGEAVTQYDLGFGGLFTAKYLGAVGQMLLQDGAYGEYRVFSPGFVQQLRPRPLVEFAPEINDKKIEWGVGFEWMADPPGDRTKGVLGPNVFGHGSATASVWRVAPDHDLVVVIGRSGFRDWGGTAQWAARFMGILAQNMEK